MLFYLAEQLLHHSYHLKDSYMLLMVGSAQIDIMREYQALD
jgi:hypothetical protein